jgi:crossover junction endodeoxyribonuclease RuvC
MVILGLDPGYGRTGYGIIKVTDKDHIALDYGIIETNKDLPFEQRLLEISKDLKNIIKKYKPEECAIEELFFGQNVKTAIHVAEARGALILKITENAIPVKTYTPLQVKSAVSGYGKADKSQVQKMVLEILNLSKIPSPDDAADALAVAICHAFNRNY